MGAAGINIDALGEIALFRGLTREQLTTLSELLRRKTFSAGTNIITAEQPGEVVYVIVSGAVKVHLEQADGTDVLIAVLAAGDTVGEMSLLDCAGRSASVVTLEETTCLWLDAAAFRQCLRTMPGMHDNLFCLLCRRLRLANEQIQSLASQDVEGRVARQLLAFARLYGRGANRGEVVIPFCLTQSDLASMVGATRERVNRVMTAYKRRQYITVDHRHRIVIHNQEALLKRAGIARQ
jgi:CRP/FNR family cyclic AMP-dependent transcriptional regulator